MSNITGPEFYRKDPYSLDLWVPYVLIGSSCVTFLAVHFWCYHKRNRDRYLRQREEKQLKDGLMERRMIATLILARYQTDLVINESNTDEDLQQTDNSMECSGGHDEDNEHNQQICADVVQEDESASMTRYIATAAESSSSHSFDNIVKTSVANEPETSMWPGDSTNFANKANVRRAHNNTDTHSHGLRESSAITNPENCAVITCETSPDVINKRSAAGSRLPLLKVLNTTSPTKGTHRIPAEISSTHGMPCQHIANRPPAPSVRCSTVFYTDISSGTQYPGTSSFQSKHSKRRCNDSSVAERHTSSADQNRASSTLSQWRDYPPQESEEVLLTSFNYCSDGTPSDNYGYTTSNITPTTKLKRRLGPRDLEAFHFQQSDQSADRDLSTYAPTVGHNTDRETLREFQSAYNTNRQSKGSSMCPDKLVFPPQPDTQTKTDAGIEAALNS